MTVVTVKKNNTYTVNDLFQWDANRRLEIYGLNLATLPEIHFANSKMSKAIVKQATSYENGVIKVEIPNILLETAAPIRVFICGYEGEEFISYYSLTINVKARPKPEDYIAEDDEKIYSYNALENLVNNTVVNLKAENAAFHDEMIAEINTLCNELKSGVNDKCTQLENAVNQTCSDTISQVNNTCSETLSQVRNIVENTPIAHADTLDGYNAEDFEFSSKPGTTVFNSDGSITTTYNDGSSETVVFNEDGSITTTRNTLELGVKTETVTFNADGSISVVAD